MTILSACQSAAVRLVGRRPTTIFSATGQLEIELAELSNEVAADILKAHEWQKFKILKTYTGDGATIAFDLPTDYDRMLVNGKVHSSSFLTAAYSHVKDENEWLYVNDWAPTGFPGYWILLGGKMNIYPAMSSAETARFYYISNLVVSGNKAAFSADNDTFLLPERLITLGLIWRWRAQKRLEYAEDLQNYGIALSQEIGLDKGARVLTVGRQRMPDDVSVAYPRALG